MLGAAVLAAAVSSSAMADDPPASDQSKAAAPAESGQDSQEPTEAENAIEIPDGDVEELMAFISQTMRNRGNTLPEVRRSARAVIDAAAKIRSLDDVTVKEELRAVEQQLSALQFLARSDEQAKQELQDLMESLAEDDRPQIRNFMEMRELQSAVATAAGKPVEEQKNWWIVCSN